jgi:GNAT superfamily N-acetyltransferase
MKTFTLADYRQTDAPDVNRIALAAFQQYQSEYSDWEVFAGRIGNMSALAAVGEIILAKAEDGLIAGAVAYVGPGKEKASYFNQEWPILRMLVVDPIFRGLGVGRLLTQECIRRAIRDSAPLIALHTSRIMTVALPMYERMGFQFECEAPSIHGVPYGVYILKLRK